MDKVLNIYLCDLTHDTILLVSDTIPINIGYVASFAKKQFGLKINITLFKYPTTALLAIKNNPPDLLGLSNYSWNSNLSEYFAEVAVNANPSVVVVQGGTNFPSNDRERTEFLMKHRFTDCHVEYEGEVSFANLVQRVIDCEGRKEAIFDSPIGGIVFLKPSAPNRSSPILIKSTLPDRIRCLDDIPSPYLTGLMDHFFDGRLTPFIETNRGCPFRCSFCHTGADYYNKINSYSIERVRDEIFYIAPRAASKNVSNLHLADTNFGMFPRDKEICQALYDARQEFGWPIQVMATTGKNSKERVIDITKILGKNFSVNMSLQSMDNDVLKNIRRDNIKLDHYIKINKHLSDAGRSTKAELIIGLPGESKESFMAGVEAVVDTDVASLTIYTLMLLTGTEFKDPAYRERFGIKGSFRIVPLNFGEYDGERILDYEEVCIETNSMSFSDYLYLRGFALFVESIHNGRPFEEIFKYIISLGIKRSAFLVHLYKSISKAPKSIRITFSDFINETKAELWASEDELTQHYKSNVNYEKLKNGEVGGNLIYKYKCKNLGFLASDWIRFMIDQLDFFIHEKSPEIQITIKSEVKSLAKFCEARMDGLLKFDSNIDPISLMLDYNIPEWLRSDDQLQLSNFKLSNEQAFTFYYTDEQLKGRNEMFTRYGTDINALSKIVTRISNLESLYRKVDSVAGHGELYTDIDVDRYTRYTLAN